MKVRAVLFDLGHTLWDLRYDSSLPPLNYRRVHRRLARSLDGPLPTAERLREAVEARFIREEAEVLRDGRLDQRPFAELIAEGLAEAGVPALGGSGRLLSTITDIILSPDIYARVMEADTVLALHALKERGLRLGVVSNTYQRGAVLREQLAAVGALPYLDVTVFSSEMGLRKPHPALFETPLAELGVPPAEAVFVGDSPREDIRGAKAIGMHTVLTRQYRQAPLEDTTPDHIIWRLPEIVEYVDHLNGAGT